jgi:chromosome segregation ATPase
VKDEKDSAEYKLIQAESSANEFKEKYMNVFEATKGQLDKSNYEELLNISAEYSQLKIQHEQDKKFIDEYRLEKANYQSQLDEKTRELEEHLKDCQSWEKSYKELSREFKKMESTPRQVSDEFENISQSMNDQTR